MSDGSGGAPQLDKEHAENLRLLKLIREEPAWALTRVKLAVELEALAASSGAAEDGLTKEEARWLRDVLLSQAVPAHAAKIALSVQLKLRARLDRKDDDDD